MVALRRPAQPAAAPGAAADAALDLAEFQAQTVQLFVGGAAGVALAFLLYVGAVAGADHASLQDAPLLAMAAALLTAAAGARALLPRSAPGAAVLLLVGLEAAEGFAQRLYPDTTVACASGLIVLVAVRLLGAPGGLGAALVATGSLALAPPAPPVARVALFVIWATAWFAWLGTHAFHTAVAWSLQSYRQAQATTEAARARQAELARLSRDLGQAYAQLARVNAELERARAAADDARRLKAEFAASVSHELRTPLNLIIGFSEMMVLNPHTYAGEQLPDTYRGDVEAIYRNACHLSNLIDDVLDLSQIDARRLALQLEPLTVREVIEEAATAVAGLFDDKGLALVIACAPDLPELTADRTRLRQVLMNLLANAARFTDHGGVTISARAVEGAVEIAVADTGAGIPPAELRAIFTEFHQVEGLQHRHTSGLGLAICKRLVEMHGGQIRAESQVGVGSTFRLTLPPHAAPVEAAAGWETWVRGGRAEARPTIAVIGDDPAVPRLLRRYLSRYDVISAPAASEALARAQAHEAQAVVATCPADLAAAVAAPLAAGETPGLPVLGCALATSQDAARALGAAAYLAKPVTRERLRAALGRLGPAARTVLVADDEPEMIRLLTRMLQAEVPECAVLRADGGRAALALLEQHRPDVILLDLLMPDLNGYAVLERLRADPRWRTIPVLIISAKGSGDDRLVAEELRVTRRGGLPMADVMRCLEASLDRLLGPPSGGSAQAPRAAPAD